MLDAYIIDIIRREGEKKDDRVQPSVGVDDFEDPRTQVDIKTPEKPSERGVLDITDFFKIELEGIVRE